MRERKTKGRKEDREKTMGMHMDIEGENSEVHT